MTVGVTVRTRGANKYTAQHVHPVRSYYVCTRGGVRATLSRTAGVRVSLVLCVCEIRRALASAEARTRKNNTAERRVHSRGCTDRGGRATGVI